MNLTYHPTSFESERFGPPPGNEAISAEGIEIAEMWGDITSDRDTSIVLSDLSQTAINALLHAFAEASAPNWDGYGAAPVEVASVSLAYNFLDLFPREPKLLPDIGVDPDGEISFEWLIRADKRLAMSFGSHAITYAFLDGPSKTHGVEIFSHEIPETILVCIRRLFREW